MPGCVAAELHGQRSAVDLATWLLTVRPDRDAHLATNANTGFSRLIQHPAISNLDKRNRWDHIRVHGDSVLLVVFVLHH